MARSRPPIGGRSAGRPSAPSTLVDILRWRARAQGDQRAYTFLVDGETQELHLTHAELDRQARAIGALLQRLGVAGERALLLYPPGLDYVAAFFGCLYAGVTAVPIVPPERGRLDRALPRLRAVMADAQPALVLTTTAILAALAPVVGQVADLGTLRWVASDETAAGMADDWQAPPLDEASLAFLQYTSGSTGRPKGVMLSHGNILHNQRLIHAAFEHDERSVVVGWLPPYHDMGLIGILLQPLYAGVPSVLLSPLHFVQRPVRWLRAVSRHRATTTGGPNFAYDLCALRIAPEDRADLDLSCWDLAFNGSEPIRADTIERFARVFEPNGFRREAFFPCYGLAEATLMVTGGPKGRALAVRRVPKAAVQRHRATDADAHEERATTLVACGGTHPDQELVIVDPESHRQCEPDQIGEIWVSGPSVALGYWRRPEETAQTFGARLVPSGRGPYLRTGDLGFVRDGVLYVVGRLKDLVIIDGRNHHPEDIERTVERSHARLRSHRGAALGLERRGAERLVVVQEMAGDAPEGASDLEEVMGTIRQAVAEVHGVRVEGVVLVPRNGIPRTSSGKTQRRACRERLVAGNLAVIGAWWAAPSTSGRLAGSP